jgi:hypothetical protein
MTLPSPPVADPSCYDEQALVARTERLAAALAGWAPRDAGDPGWALVRVFARMMGHVVERLDRVPGRNFLAFLDLVGVEPAPARPARVPLTFSLVEQGEAEPVVPAGTRVAAQPSPDDTREIVFETTAALPTTRARLAKAVVVDPASDRWADRTDIATGQADGWVEALAGATPIEHALYVAADDVFGLPAGTVVSVTFSSSNDAAWRSFHEPDAPLVAWQVHDGSGWIPCPPRLRAGTAATFDLTLPDVVALQTVGGRSARWIRLSLTRWPAGLVVPQINGITVSAPLTVAPQGAFANGRPLDLSADLYPFGERPRTGDVLQVTSDALSQAGRRVTLTLTPSAAAPAALAPGNLAWDVWTSAGWAPLTVQTDPPGTGVLRSVSFTVPSAVAPAVIAGATGYCLRARLVGGDFGKGPEVVSAPPPAGSPAGTPATITLVDNGYRPPLLGSLALSFTPDPVTPLRVTSNDLALVERAGPFTPFTHAPGAPTALYFGFDRAFANGPVGLHLQVAPLSPSDALQASGATPAIVWEYGSGSDWAPLGVEDETHGLSTSGLVRFTGPRDLVRRAELGQGAWWWLRARLLGPAPAPMPKIGRVLTNTTWAAHTATRRGESLGSSSGGAAQVFPMAQRPVLEGQQIEVREPAVPPAEEQSAIERLEGAGAVTVVGDPQRPDEVWVRWHEVPDLADAGPRDRSYRIDRAAGTVRFGDGQHGMAPPRGTSNVRAAIYRTGGGADGNRATGTVSQLKTTVPYVDGVTHHEPATGGADPEDRARLEARGPRILRHGDRAVAAQDFEDLACAASPAVARARALTPHFDPVEQEESPGPIADAGSVVVVIVPFGTEPRPTPSLGLLLDVQAHLEARTAPGLPLRVIAPDWVVVHVTALSVVPASVAAASGLREAIEAAIAGFLHPLTGNLGAGWSFGQVPHKSDLLGLLSAIPGVDSVRHLRFEKRHAGSGAELDETAAGREALERVLISPGSCAVELRAPEPRG